MIFEHCETRRFYVIFENFLISLLIYLLITMFENHSKSLILPWIFLAKIKVANYVIRIFFPNVKIQMRLFRWLFKQFVVPSFVDTANQQKIGTYSFPIYIEILKYSKLEKLKINCENEKILNEILRKSKKKY